MPRCRGTIMAENDESIYVISCRQDLLSMGIDRVRSRLEGMGETRIALDWTQARLVPVVSAERASFQPGEARILRIRPIKVGPNAAVLPSYYGVNGMGHLLCIGAQEFVHFSKERIADSAMFQSRIKASILPDDLLGQVFVVPPLT
ncbi:MAG: DUF22 domain-containing protein [Candidatus Thorarchaeota archaeon]